MNLRPYQKECIETIKNKKAGRYLIQMATGLGKTVTFAQLENVFEGRILILSHREELVEQPRKYFKSSYGIERAKFTSNGERIISASVQSIVRRLENFNRYEFECIIVDEAHHTAAKTYRKILDYFDPLYVLGFTATPNRGDKIGLSDCYQDIIFEKDLKFGIKNNYLTDIECKKVDIGYDLSGIRKVGGDFNQGQLSEKMNIEDANKAIAKIVKNDSRGQTIIFCVSVDHCKELSKLIPSSKVIDGKTKNRQEIIDDFTNRKFKTLINCMVFTEGTDIPLIETVIIARPTQNASLYTQMVGRGLRLHQDKEKTLLIDCVGVSNIPICTAPTLLGLKTDNVPQDKQPTIEGDLFDLEEKIIMAQDCPESWVKNIKIVDLWSQEMGYNTHNVHYFKMPNGDFVLNIPDFIVKLPKQDELGYTRMKNGMKIKFQKALDLVYTHLVDKHGDKRPLWDANIVKRWKAYPATDKQKDIIAKKLKIDTSNLNKMEASLILSRIFNKKKGEKIRV